MLFVNPNICNDLKETHIEILHVIIWVEILFIKMKHYFTNEFKKYVNGWNWMKHIKMEQYCSTRCLRHNKRGE